MVFLPFSLCLYGAPYVSLPMSLPMLDAARIGPESGSVSILNECDDLGRGKARSTRRRLLRRLLRRMRATAGGLF